MSAASASNIDEMESIYERALSSGARKMWSCFAGLSKNLRKTGMHLR